MTMIESKMIRRSILPRTPKSRERGSALIEFMLSSLVWLPLLLGVIFIGLNIVRAIEVTQICRDAGHMHAYGVDFAQPANQQLLVKLATDFTFTANSGNGVVILSTITFIGPADCQAAGLAANASQCANLNQSVFTRRIVVGNKQLRVSAFGTPSPSSIDSDGNISATSYLNNISLRATSFSSVLPLQSGQFAYLSEAYFASPDLDFPGFLSGSGTYSRAIF
jgi:hypothetical protein